MTIIDISSCAPDRLRKECSSRNLDSSGSRKELIERLKLAGVQSVNISVSPEIPIERIIHTKTVKDLFHIENVENFTADFPGKEGDLRRHLGTLYMYRSTNVVEGWYPITFGSVKVI